MSGLIPDYLGMPELLPDGHINPARRRAERRWEEREANRLMIADRVGRVAATPDQEIEDARTVARQVAERCRQAVKEKDK